MTRGSFRRMHMTLAAFAATGFAVAGVHAAMIYQEKNVLFHPERIHHCCVFASIAAVLQPISGDLSAKDVAQRQPAKLAAMEAHFFTQKSAPLLVGGIPDNENKKVDYAIELPGMLSFLAHGDLDAEVKGLDTIPVRPATACRHCSLCIPDHGGLWHVPFDDVRSFFFWDYCEKNGLRQKWFLMLFIYKYPAWIYCYGSRMDCNGSWTTAMDHLWNYADVRCPDANEWYRLVLLSIHVPSTSLSQQS